MILDNNLKKKPLFRGKNSKGVEKPSDMPLYGTIAPLKSLKEEKKPEPVEIVADVTQKEKGKDIIRRNNYRNYNGQKRKAVAPEKKIKITFLGGLNEIGKNLTAYEYEDEIIIVDCGMAFPNEQMLGIDLVIPDYTYLEQNVDKIKAIILTHGHEDHIGGLPFFLKKINTPIYGTKLTLGLVEGKLKEHHLLESTKLIVVPSGKTVNIGRFFKIDFIAVNHSIPDAVGFAIHTPAGVVVTTGDFKIDTTPIHGEMIDIAKFAQLGKEGVLALLADSTNASRPGYTMSERKVGSSFDNLFKQAETKRIIIATFASNIHRVQQIIDCAIKYDRKVALSGRSMLNVMSIAIELGYLKVPDGLLIDISMLNRYPVEKVVLITTGSQGEPMSALTRMAYSEHRKVEVGEQDFIIISATPIPGNEKTVSGVINELLKRGCKVVHESMYEVHVSGHACQEELKMIMGVTKPKFFIPVHGEQMHLRKNAAIAMQMGIDEKNIFIGDIGSSIEISKSEMKILPPVVAGNILVDGLGVGDVGSIVLRDRKHLGEDGLIVVVCTIDSSDGHVISGPDIVSRGFVYVRQSEDLMNDVRRITAEVIENCSSKNIHDWTSIKTKIKDELSELFYQKTKRNPMILPVIMEV